MAMAPEGPLVLRASYGMVTAGPMTVDSANKSLLDADRSCCLLFAASFAWFGSGSWGFRLTLFI